MTLPCDRFACAFHHLFQEYRESPAVAAPAKAARMTALSHLDRVLSLIRMYPRNWVGSPSVMQVLARQCQTEGICA